MEYRKDVILILHEINFIAINQFYFLRQTLCVRFSLLPYWKAGILLVPLDFALQSSVKFPGNALSIP